MLSAQRCKPRAPFPVLAPDPVGDYAFGMITVEKTKTDVRVTIPNDALPRKQLDAFLDWLRLEETVQRSLLSENEASRIADQIKSEWWTANKDKFIPPGKE